MANSQATSPVSRPPNPIAMVFHFMKTFALTGSILNDSRVKVAPKVIFVAVIGVLLAAALGVDAAGELVSNVIPVAGPILGIPVDAVVDWGVLSVVAFNLLKLFPAHIVGEHYDRLFRGRKNASQG